MTTDVNDAGIVNNNPAGMAFLPDDANGSLGGILILGLGDFEVDENKTTVDGGDPNNDLEPLFVPNAAYSRRINDDWRWGVSMYIPNGFGSDNGSSWAGRYYSDQFSLAWVSLTASLSYRFSETLSFGVALNTNYNYSETTIRVRNLEPDSSDGKVEFDGDAVGFNGAASLMYQPRPGTRFGLVYHSESSADLEGDVEFKGIGPGLGMILDELGLRKFELEFENIMPARWQLGAAHTLENGHYLTADAMWVEFSEFGTGEISIEGTTVGKPESTHNDIWAFMFGYNIPLDSRRTLGLGLMHLTEPVDDEDRTLAFSLDKAWAVGAGLKYNLKSGATLDFNFNLMISGDGAVDTGDNPAQGRVVGEVNDPYSLMFDLTYNF